MNRQSDKAPYKLFFFQPWAHSGNTRWWLDAFAPVRFRLAGRWWKSAEHFYQGFKFKHQRHHLAKIANARTALQAKILSQPIKHAAHPRFAPLKYELMAYAFYEKFRQNPRHKKWLLHTGLAELIEDNRDDAVWGTGPDGNGQNQIGKALMRARAMLRGKQPLLNKVLLRRF